MTIEALIQANTNALVALTQAILTTAGKANTTAADAGVKPTRPKAETKAETTKAAGISAEELTKVIVTTAQKVGGPAVKEVLAAFGVAKGSEITDPGERVKLAAAIAALANEADDLG